jgi:DNA-directed RNA polymerase
MTIPYNAKLKSNWGYVKEALCDKEKGKGLDCTKEEITQVTHALRNAVWDRDTETGIFPGPIKVMDWIEEAVRECLDRGDTELVWETPSGFIVSQKIMKPDVTVMKLSLLGVSRQVTVATKDSDVVNKAKHISATSPNLIHSLDASLLHLAFQRFDAPFSVIHDSVLCRATDMHILSELVRETYMYLFAENDYLQDWANQIGVSLNPDVIIDTLRPESVIESTYFFC